MSEIFELTTSEQWDAAWPALASLRKDLSREDFLNSREKMIADGYQLFGLQSAGRIVSVAGLIIYPHITRERDCWIYDLATLEEERSKGFGEKILRFVEAHAKERGCSRICLHTRLSRIDAQRFYETKAQYDQYAYVYKKDI